VTAPVSPAPSGPASNATLAEVGLQATYLDRSVDPCVDFVQFACGGWLATSQIPADAAGASTQNDAAEKTRATVKELLEQATGPLGDYYASCMDEAAIEKAGIAAVKPLLDKTLKVKDARSWLAALVELHKVAIWSVFSLSLRPDPANPTLAIVAIGLPRLGLVERAAYIDASRKELREAYEQHVARMLGLAGMAKPERAAADVVAIETELAKLIDPASPPEVVMDGKAIAKQTKSIDWKAYTRGLGAAANARMYVLTPKYLADLDGVRKRFKPAQWAGYFTYQLLADMAFALPKAYGDEAFALDQKLNGTPAKPPRFKRCVRNTAFVLRDLVDQVYAGKALSATGRQNATAAVDAVVAAMRDDVGTLDWMADATRQDVVDRLGKLGRVIGIPDAWHTYDFAIKRDDFAGNALRGVSFKIRQWFAQAGKSAAASDLAELSTTFTRPVYRTTVNVLAVPAGFLQPPYYADQRSVAANLGGMGTVLGNELAFSIASELPRADRLKLETQAECLAHQYGSFEAAPKQFIDGKRTLESNVADVAAVKLAFRAYRSLRKSAAQPIVADGFTEDQQFFLAVGQASCSKLRPAELQRILSSSMEAPPKFRVYGALRNLPEFAQAFSCAAGTPMHPAQTCSVW
jgi:putative endopeptidase